MAHKHSVYDTDTHFSIDADIREISTASGNAVLIQHDHNSERLTFEIPRMIDGHDMSLCNLVQVHYLNINAATREQKEGVYYVDDLQISPDSDDVVILSWLVSQNATKFVGSLNFIIRFSCISDDGTVDYVWNTAIYKGITVAEGIDNTDTVVEENADIFAQWESRIAALEQGATSYVLTENDKTDIANIVINEYDSSIMSVLGVDDNATE